MGYKFGSELTKEEQQEVLARCIHRYTKDFKPVHVQRLDRMQKTPIPVQFESDADWLAHTEFVTTATGKLDRRSKSHWTTGSRK